MEEEACRNKAAAHGKIELKTGSYDLSKEVLQVASVSLTIWSHIAPSWLSNFLSDELAKSLWLLSV